LSIVYINLKNEKLRKIHGSKTIKKILKIIRSLYNYKASEDMKIKWSIFNFFIIKRGK